MWFHSARLFSLVGLDLYCPCMKQTICGNLPVLLAVALGSACLVPAIGQESSSVPAGKALTLDGAIRLALESNPQLRAAGSQIASATGRAYQSKLWSNPDLELSAEDWPTDGGGFQAMRARQIPESGNVNGRGEPMPGPRAFGGIE